MCVYSAVRLIVVTAITPSEKLRSNIDHLAEDKDNLHSLWDHSYTQREDFDARQEVRKFQ